MKTLLLALVLLVPTLARADCSSDQNTVRKIENGVESLSQQSQITCVDRTKKIFSDCELFQWEHAWGVGTSVSCNWTERQAMDAALTYAKNGDKIEWYDTRGNKGYVVVAWTRPMSNSGVCRDIEVVKYFVGSQDKNNYIMCNGPDGRWRSFKGY